MKLALLVNSLYGGGAEILNIELLNWAKNAHLYLLEKRVNYAFDKEKTTFINGEKVIDSSLLNYLSTPISAFRLNKTLSNETIIIASLFRSLLVSVLLKTLFNKKQKVVFWCHLDPKAIPNRKPFGTIAHKFYTYVYQQADLIICNSLKAKNDFNKIFGVPTSQVKTIYNSFDIEKIAIASNESIDKEDSKLFEKDTLICVGRLNEQKGHRYLLEVFSKILMSAPETNLILLGDGELRAALQEQSIQLGIEKNVHFLGFKKNPFRYIKKANLLVFSSIYEGFGNVLIEAMASGTPVLSADIDNGPREIIAPNSDFLKRTTQPDLADNGVLMPAFDKPDAIQIWSNTIISLLQNKEQLVKLSENGKVRAMHFSKKKILPEFIDNVNNFFKVSI